MAYVFRGVTLSDDLRDSIDRYVEQGVQTGGFLQACIENNLCEAIGRADESSLAMLPAIVGYLYNEVDQRCWGRPGVFAEWINLKREERETHATL